jgi:hypothetical protein
MYKMFRLEWDPSENITIFTHTRQMIFQVKLLPNAAQLIQCTMIDTLYLNFVWQIVAIMLSSIEFYLEGSTDQGQHAHQMQPINVVALWRCRNHSSTLSGARRSSISATREDKTEPNTEEGGRQNSRRPSKELAGGRRTVCRRPGGSGDPLNP